MPFTTAQLATELTTDPANLGYAALIAAGNDRDLAAALNLVRSGTSADNKSYTVWRNDVSPKEVVNCIAPADFTNATQIQITKLNLLFTGNSVDATLSNVRANMANIFSGASAATTNALAAVSRRNGSRAESLWGTGTSVSADDVAKALRG